MLLIPDYLQMKGLPLRRLYRQLASEYPACTVNPLTYQWTKSEAAP